MKVLNGKLTIPQPNGLKFLHFQLETLTQNLEDLESHITSVNLQEREEYLQRINSIEASVQHLEQLYHRLFSTTVVASVTLAVLFFGVTSTREVTASKSAQETSIVPVVEQSVSQH
ncbi:MAG: hypothetical protein HC920_21015 [Oscillatoriales cyanobacterium SM2_3_0]|nr:hypothetical protein [Oscillatoriales cyanobacterium SM2_3_0]